MIFEAISGSVLSSKMATKKCFQLKIPGKKKPNEANLLKAQTSGMKLTTFQHLIWLFLKWQTALVLGYWGSREAMAAPSRPNPTFEQTPQSAPFTPILNRHGDSSTALGTFQSRNCPCPWAGRVAAAAAVAGHPAGCGDTDQPLAGASGCSLWAERPPGVQKNLLHLHSRVRRATLEQEGRNQGPGQPFVKIWRNWESIKLNHSQLPPLFVSPQAITLQLWAAKISVFAFFNRAAISPLLMQLLVLPSFD